MRRTIANNLLVLGALLLAAEVVGQAYYRWTTGAFLRHRSLQYERDAATSDAVFEPHPYLVARPRGNARVERSGATITTTALHTRTTGARPPRPGAIAVAVVGGSTTFGTRLSDADSWPWLLQERLGDGYTVVNFGVPGYSTAENIVQMALLVPEAGAHIVVFYEGWNDIRNYHWPGFQPDYYWHGMTQFDTLIPPALDRASFLTRAARFSFLLRMLGGAVGVRLDAAGDEPSSAPDPEVDRVYVRNLTTLKALAARFDMHALFVPQVLNDEGLRRAGAQTGWTPYVQSAALVPLMRRFNGLMAGVCGPEETRCTFVGEPLTAPWSNDDFLDEGHLSRRGGEKLADMLAARISQLTTAPVSLSAR